MRRGKRNAAYVAASVRWQQEHGGAGEPTDGGAFIRDVLSRLQGVPLRVMAGATGLSKGYCSFVRRGRKVPHRRHWKVLKRLGDDHDG